MLKTSTRLLRLLSLLQSRRHWSGAELSERLGVDARTVRRDVDRLRELGYPVNASSGLGGGYQLGAGSSVPPVLLSDDEAVAVAVALRAAAGSVGNMEETAIGLLSKLDQILPPRLRRRAGALYAVTVSLAADESVPDVEMLTQIATACRDRLLLKLAYRDRVGKATTRQIEPLRLAHTERRWYLVAWDIERADWRTFRVDRIQRLIGMGPAFPPREFPGDIAEYVARAITQLPYRHRVRLRLHGALDVLSASVHPWCGVLEAETATTCILSTGADTVEMLAAQMLIAGVDFDVLDAPELLPQLQHLAERLGRAVGHPAHIRQ